MSTYTERAYNVSDEDEIKRISAYIAKLKAELARVRGLDPVEFWWDEIGRVQKLMDPILAIKESKRTDAQVATLERLTAERATYILNYRVAREPRRNGKMATDPSAWEDITGDVVWRQTEFTQVARTGPGSFTITLKGSHPEFRGGEQIRLEIEGLRSFGGWVTGVERGYFFADAVEPMTVLHGTDYNILFDRLVTRNYPWEYSASRTRSRMMMGTYRVIPAFAQGTLDSEMINTVFDEYLLPDLPLGFDYTSHVDGITSPAPVSDWVMPTDGSALRMFMQSVSQITSGVWCIDATMALQYHDREVIRAPYPITDGLGGISSTNLRITADISNMINDVIVWGTLSRNGPADDWNTIAGEIMVWHEYGDIQFWERYWMNLINRLQGYIAKLLARRQTTAVKKAIATYRKRIIDYKGRLEEARSREWDPLSGLPRPKNAIVSSIDTWGRWQAAEIREDIHHMSYLQIRGHSILTRFDEPIIRASATIWDPGYQAGMVVNLKSAEHKVDTNLPIRSMKISFVVGKEPREGKYYTVPRYDLEMGLDPEAPWNIYDYLPFPGEGTSGVGGDVAGG